VEKRKEESSFKKDLGENRILKRRRRRNN